MDIKPYIQFNRKLSSGLSARLAKTGVTPNQLTLTGLAMGILAGVCMAQGTRGWLFLGAFFLHAAFILDNCDGEIARLKNCQSRWGGWLDKISDLLVDLALWTGLFVGCLTRNLTSFIETALFWAVLGSLTNFLIVVLERTQDVSSSAHAYSGKIENRKKSFLFSLLDTLSHNGDSIALVWLGALTGNPWIFLMAGAYFINFLWLARFLANIRFYGSALARGFQKTAGTASPGKIILKLVFLGFGIYLFKEAFQFISWQSLKELFAKGGAGLLLVLLVFPVTCFFHTVGFSYLFPKETRRKMPFPSLFAIYLTGDSVNKVTPFIDIGGEPLKIMLAHRKGLASFGDCVTATCMARIVFIVSEIIFIVMGLAALSFLYPSPEIFWVTVIAIAGSGVLLALLISAQMKGAVKVIPQITRVFKQQKENNTAWEVIDKDLRSFYRKNLKDFLLSTFWNVLGWAAVLFEVYMTFRVFGIEMTLTQAFIIQSLLQAIKTVSFFIPGNLGAQEGGLAFLLAHMSFSATQGFALSLVKRLRQWVWAVIGPLLYFLFFRGKEKSV